MSACLVQYNMADASRPEDIQERYVTWNKKPEKAIEPALLLYYNTLNGVNQVM